LLEGELRIALFELFDRDDFEGLAEWVADVCLAVLDAFAFLVVFFTRGLTAPERLRFDARFAGDTNEKIL